MGPQEYYRGSGPMTAAGRHAGELRALSGNLAELCETVQGLLIHRDLAPHLYGLKLSAAERDVANLRPLSEMLSRARAYDDEPLTTPREPAKRVPSVCRHFTVLLCGTLRARGVPARARCGFGGYFGSGKFEDHWVCEYWSDERRRWILVDAQLDAVQCASFKPDFDPLDVPRDRFVIAGDAWQTCRSGSGDPRSFGLSFIPGLHGYWFIAANVIRDLAALNRMEMLPWDVWGMMRQNDEALDDGDRKLLDRVAALTLGGDEGFPEVRDLYESDERFRVPPSVFNVDRNAEESIEGEA